MIQGTMSSVGKSLLTTGLCRVFKQDGYSVAPFKSQNMSRFSYKTGGGLEMSRAQAVQAEAAGTQAEALMNPVLLKPVTDMGAEVIVNGISRGHKRAAEYFKYKKTLIPEIMRSFEELSARHDIIVIEGAGSPAEINLKQHDIVNMGLAELTGSPVLLVGDIDCGGVFAQIVGTLVLLNENERNRIKGTVVNKFRGDIEIFRPGIAMLEEKSGKPVVGVLPYLNVSIGEEDSLIRGNEKNRENTCADTFEFRQSQYDILAAAIRENLNMPFIYDVLEGNV
jgi:adenosylcobyric acid synthase